MAEVAYEVQGVSAEQVPVPDDSVQPEDEVHRVEVSVLHALAVPVHEPVDDHVQPLADRQSVLVGTELHAVGVPKQVPYSYQEQPVPLTHAAWGTRLQLLAVPKQVAVLAFQVQPEPVAQVAAVRRVEQLYAVPLQYEELDAVHVQPVCLAHAALVVW